MQGMQIAKCVFNFAVLCCLSWVIIFSSVQPEDKMGLEHKRRSVCLPSSADLGRARSGSPACSCLGGCRVFTNQTSLGQSVLNRKASLMDLLTRVIRVHRNSFVIATAHRLHAIADVSKRSAKARRIGGSLHQGYSTNADFLHRHHTAGNSFEGFVREEKAFRHRLSLLMVLAAAKNRAGWALKPKEKFSLRPKLPLYGHSSVWFGNFKLTQCPLKSVK